MDESEQFFSPCINNELNSCNMANWEKSHTHQLLLIMYLNSASQCKSRRHSLRNLSSVSGVLSLSVNMAVVAFCLVISL